MRFTAGLASAFVLLTSAVLSCGGLASAQTPAQPCADPAFHALDFWVGDWIVRTASGAQIGRSRVDSILGGCAVHEHWFASNGGTGESLTSLDPASKTWRQHWISWNGTQSDYVGKVDGRDVVMIAPGVDAAGKPQLLRMRFSPLPDGRVRQYMEASSDNGTTWAPAFDGYYARTGQ
ncbi:MAG TPA: hypothetical protein VHT05_10070 [Candidatus Elarobacter sp.]|jgi:hypothetical protein|nr:hypothetical protein [Candidatus Elarobacter sp.]